MPFLQPRWPRPFDKVQSHIDDSVGVVIQVSYLVPEGEPPTFLVEWETGNLAGHRSWAFGDEVYVIEAGGFIQNPLSAPCSWCRSRIGQIFAAPDNLVAEGLTDLHEACEQRARASIARSKKGQVPVVPMSAVPPGARTPHRGRWAHGYDLSGERMMTTHASLPDDELSPPAKRRKRQRW